MARPLAIVTGASAGIGSVFADKLAARGHDLVLVARNRERLEEAARRLETAHGIRAEALAADLATDDGVRAVEARIRAEESLELLVNNAGFGTLGDFVDADFGPQVEMHRLHVMAPLRLCRAALEGMTVRRKGAIINVSSVAGFFVAPGSVSYSATKHWMNVFTEGVHLELKRADSPVKIQALCPGFTYSEFHDRLGVDRKRIPKWLWLSADQVVSESLRGLDRGQVFVVTGWQYRMIVRLSKLIPTPLLHAVNARRAWRVKK